MTPKNLADARRFLSSDAGAEFIADLQKKRPKINLVGEGIDDSAVIRMASRSAGWEECLEAIELLAKPPKIEVDSPGYIDFTETKKESKK